MRALSIIADLVVVLAFTFGAGFGIKAATNQMAKTLHERTKKGFSSQEKLSNALTSEKLDF